MNVKVDLNLVADENYMRICGIDLEYYFHKFRILAFKHFKDDSLSFKLYELFDEDEFKIEELYTFTIPEIEFENNNKALYKLMYDYGSGYINHFFSFGLPHSRYVNFEIN